VDPKLAHTAFPIERTGAHVGGGANGGGQCLSCHPSNRTDPHKTFAADFTVVTCTGCHVQFTSITTPTAAAVWHDDSSGSLASYHAGVPVTGFATDATSCLQCHPDGAGAPPPYHGQLFPVDAASKHAGIACGSCHGADRANTALLQCASCHADSTKSPSFPTVHDPVGSTTTVLASLTPPPASCQPVFFPPTSAQCLECHALSHVDLLASHPAGDNSFARSEHARAGCLTCHVVTKQVTAAGAPSSYTAVDFATFLGTLTNAPISPTDPIQVQGCYTCHGYGCAGNGR
jgi:hypothetical protein